MTDIVERLRKPASVKEQTWEWSLRHEAADEIERLQFALAEARKAMDKQFKCTKCNKSIDQDETLWLPNWEDGQPYCHACGCITDTPIPMLKNSSMTKAKNPRRPTIPYVRRFRDRKNDYRRKPKHPKRA